MADEIKRIGSGNKVIPLSQAIRETHSVVTQGTAKPGKSSKEPQPTLTDMTSIQVKKEQEKKPDNLISVIKELKTILSKFIEKFSNFNKETNNNANDLSDIKKSLETLLKNKLIILNDNQNKTIQQFVNQLNSKILQTLDTKITDLKTSISNSNQTTTTYQIDTSNLQNILTNTFSQFNTNEYKQTLQDFTTNLKNLNDKLTNIDLNNLTIKSSFDEQTISSITEKISAKFDNKELTDTLKNLNEKISKSTDSSTKDYTDFFKSIITKLDNIKPANNTDETEKILNSILEKLKTNINDDNTLKQVEQLIQSSINQNNKKQQNSSQKQPQNLQSNINNIINNINTIFSYNTNINLLKSLPQKLTKYLDSKILPQSNKSLADKSSTDISQSIQYFPTLYNNNQNPILKQSVTLDNVSNQNENTVNQNILIYANDIFINQQKLENTYDEIINNFKLFLNDYETNLNQNTTKNKSKMNKFLDSYIDNTYNEKNQNNDMYKAFLNFYNDYKNTNQKMLNIKSNINDFVIPYTNTNNKEDDLQRKKSNIGKYAVMSYSALGEIIAENFIINPIKKGWDKLTGNKDDISKNKNEKLQSVNLTQNQKQQLQKQQLRTSSLLGINNIVKSPINNTIGKFNFSQNRLQLIYEENKINLLKKISNTLLDSLDQQQYLNRSFKKFRKTFNNKFNDKFINAISKKDKNTVINTNTDKNKFNDKSKDKSKDKSNDNSNDNGLIGGLISGIFGGKLVKSLRNLFKRKAGSKTGSPKAGSKAGSRKTVSKTGSPKAGSKAGSPKAGSKTSSRKPASRKPMNAKNATKNVRRIRQARRGLDAAKKLNNAKNVTNTVKNIAKPASRIVKPATQALKVGGKVLGKAFAYYNLAEAGYGLYKGITMDEKQRKEFIKEREEGEFGGGRFLAGGDGIKNLKNTFKNEGIWEGTKQAGLMALNDAVGAIDFVEHGHGKTIGVFIRQVGATADALMEANRSAKAVKQLKIKNNAQLEKRFNLQNEKILEKINQRIERGEIKDAAGNPIKKQLTLADIDRDIAQNLTNQQNNMIQQNLENSIKEYKKDNEVTEQLINRNMGSDIDGRVLNKVLNDISRSVLKEDIFSLLKNPDIPAGVKRNRLSRLLNYVTDNSKNIKSKIWLDTQTYTKKILEKDEVNNRYDRIQTYLTYRIQQLEKIETNNKFIKERENQLAKLKIQQVDKEILQPDNLELTKSAIPNIFNKEMFIKSSLSDEIISKGTKNTQQQAITAWENQVKLNPLSPLQNGKYVPQNWITNNITNNNQQPASVTIFAQSNSQPDIRAKTAGSNE